MSREKVPGLGLLVLLALLAGGCGGALVGGLIALTIERGYEVPALGALIPTQTATITPTSSPTTTSTPTPTFTATPLPTATPTPTATPLPSLADVIARVGASVVTVAVSEARDEEPQGFGSGVLLFEPDIVVTNFHVVEEAALIRVITQDEREIPATLVGGDFFTDIAVLRLEESAELRPLSLTVRDELRVGEPVLAIGSALGDFRNSVTGGIISGLERLLYVDEVGFAYEGLIQTDAAINRGNSGGPLLDASGNVIGINTLVVRGTLASGEIEGLGFAIPAQTVEETARQLIAEGKIDRPFFGIVHQSITPSLARRVGIPQNEGIVVLSVAPQSPAEQAGIRSGDLLLAIEAITIDEQHPFVNLLMRHAIGETVEVRLLRDDEEQLVRVTLGTQDE